MLGLSRCSLTDLYPSGAQAKLLAQSIRGANLNQNRVVFLFFNFSVIFYPIGIVLAFESSL